MPSLLAIFAPRFKQLQRRGERRATINEVLDGLRRLRIYVLERYISLSEDTTIYAV